MGSFLTSVKFLIVELVSLLVMLAIGAALVAGIIYVGLYSSYQTAFQESLSFLASGDPAAVGGVLLLVIIVLLVINVYVFGALSQSLWGWDADHSVFRTGIKFVFIGLVVWVFRRAANIGLELAVVMEYGSIDEFVTALEAGSTDAYLYLGAALLIGLVAFWLVGYLGRLIGWD